MSGERAIQFLRDAARIIEAAKDNEIDGATYGLVAVALMHALKALSNNVSADIVGPQQQQQQQRMQEMQQQPQEEEEELPPPQQHEHDTIILEWRRDLHLLAVPRWSTLQDLRQIIAARTNVQPERQWRLLYNEAQVGGLWGNDGPEGETQLQAVMHYQHV